MSQGEITIPEGMEGILSDYGPHVTSHSGHCIGFGFRIIGRASGDQWEALKALGQIINDNPSYSNGRYFLVIRWLTPSEAVEAYGPVSKLEVGPKGGFRSVSYGPNMSTVSRQLDPRKDSAVDVPKAVIVRGLSKREIRKRYAHIIDGLPSSVIRALCGKHQ